MNSPGQINFKSSAPLTMRPPQAGDPVRDPLDEPVDDPIQGWASRAFIQYAIFSIVAGCLAYAIALRVFVPDQTARPLLVLLFMAIAGVSWILLARQRAKAAVLVLGIGTWVYITVMLFFFGGTSAAGAYLYPLIILLFGWLVSMRAGIVVAILTAIATGALALAELGGIFLCRV